MIPYRTGGKVPGPRGEALRDRKDPSLSELLARRVIAIDPGGVIGTHQHGSGDISRVYNANRMAEFFSQWDLPASLPTLKTRVARCASIVQSGEGEPSRHDGLEATIASLTLLRLAGKDPIALDDYANWVRTVTPSGFSFFPIEMFEPIWKNPDHPAIVEAVAFLFADPKSPWVPLFRPGDRGWNESGFRSDIVTSPLLGLVTFRRLVLLGLRDQRPNGSIVTDAAGNIKVSVGEEWSTNPNPANDDPLRPKPSTTMPLRLADLYCWMLERLEGTPPFEMDWPEAKRDAAIAETTAFLIRYGERFRYLESVRSLYDSQPFAPRHNRAILAFPPLDRPATMEDVKAGRAIFHLDGTEVRRWPLPSAFLEARWTTLKISPNDPGLGQFRGYDKKVGEQGERPSAQIEMLQGGRVWQAEEVKEGGKWRRFYGFVGREAPVRLAAEEIEFPPEWNTGWYKFSVDLDARIVPPGGRDDGKMVVPGDVAPGKALPIEVAFRNHRGIDVKLPGDAIRLDGGLSLGEGLSIRLERLREPNPDQAPERSADPIWDEIPAREVRHHRADGTSKPLSPTEVDRSLRIELRDLFDIKDPGRYQLTLRFEDQKDDEGKPGQVTTFFTLASPSN